MFRRHCICLSWWQDHHIICVLPQSLSDSTSLPKREWLSSYLLLCLPAPEFLSTSQSLTYLSSHIPLKQGRAILLIVQIRSWDPQRLRVRFPNVFSTKKCRWAPSGICKKVTLLTPINLRVKHLNHCGCLENSFKAQTHKGTLAPNPQI